MNLVFTQCAFGQILFSKVMGFFANRRLGFLTRWWISAFVRYYQVNTDDILNYSPAHFRTFNAFFTRTLKPNARSLNSDPHAVISPVDGAVVESGIMEKGQLIQAKGHDYSLTALMAGNSALIEAFDHGAYLTAYLAPKDYHRVHMPLKGRLIHRMYVPGTLFSVNTRAVSNIPNLFARNERVICVFETESGLMSVILVGAMIVGSIQTIWTQSRIPNHAKGIHQWDFENQTIVLEKGAELGHFEMGSTVVVLFQANRVRWDNFKPKDSLKLYQSLGKII
ncbi:MAG TPA: archaetidylserine decarboxylase [Coxiellaceae bacterium]|nr:archaetidylserine decarboxylase [Coxiellaceae bacterium]